MGNQNLQRRIARPSHRIPGEVSSGDSRDDEKSTLPVFSVRCAAFPINLIFGKVIAVTWVRAVDETDAKLREANGSYYLVRTVRLVPGQKNALEIYLDGERIWRAAYAG